jgi:hypothetical protein
VSNILVQSLQRTAWISQIIYRMLKRSEICVTRTTYIIQHSSKTYFVPTTVPEYHLYFITRNVLCKSLMARSGRGMDSENLRWLLGFSFPCFRPMYVELRRTVDHKRHFTSDMTITWDTKSAVFSQLNCASHAIAMVVCRQGSALGNICNDGSGGVLVVVRWL